MTAEGRSSRNAAAAGEAARPRPVEIELKYRARTLAAGERILAADDLVGLVADAPTATTHYEDRYVDTADGALKRAGFAARLRTTVGGTIVSLKSTARRAAGDRGPHRREELEGPASLSSGPRDWPASDARSVILETCGDEPLVEILTLRQVRRRRILRDAAASVELSLDEVEVVAGGEAVDRWVELEAELVKGDERRLLDLAAALVDNDGLTPARKSKLERARSVLRTRAKRQDGPQAVPAGIEGARPAGAGERERGDAGNGHTPIGEAGPVIVVDAPGSAPATARPPKPVLPKSPGVLADDPVAEAGRKILRFHFARMVAREAGTRDGADPEDLHAMRVATRRMRAGWRIFGWAFRGGRTKRLRDRLRDVAGRLGAVRDLDVLLDGLEAYRADLPATEQRALQPLVDAWGRDRTTARELLIRELDSDAYRRFVEDLDVFVRTEGAAVRDVQPTEPHLVRDTAPSRIWQAYEQVRSYESVLRWADVETLHDLRIAAKWLRYSLEFVREPLGTEAEALIPRVVALQDHLGWLHDADVSAAMARTFLVERSGTVSALESAAIGRYLVARERELARLRRSVGRPWRGVAGLAFRRRLGRAVANL